MNFIKCIIILIYIYILLIIPQISPIVWEIYIFFWIIFFLVSVSFEEISNDTDVLVNLEYSKKIDITNRNKWDFR